MSKQPFSSLEVRGGYLADVAHCMSCHGQVDPILPPSPGPKSCRSGLSVRRCCRLGLPI
jgi:hypothetical protein